MAARGFPLQAGRQRLLKDSKVLRHLRKRLGRRATKLLSYYVPETRRFCIAVWVDRVQGRVQEIMSYDNEREFRQTDAEFVAYWTSPRRRADILAARQRTLENQRALARQQDDRHREDDARRQFRDRQRTIHQRGNLIWQTIPAF